VSGSCAWRIGSRARYRRVCALQRLRRPRRCDVAGVGGVACPPSTPTPDTLGEALATRTVVFEKLGRHSAAGCASAFPSFFSVLSSRCAFGTAARQLLPVGGIPPTHRARSRPRAAGRPCGPSHGNRARARTFWVCAGRPVGCPCGVVGRCVWRCRAKRRQRCDRWLH